MKLWNISNRETPELRHLGLVGVAVTIGGIEIPAGGSADVPAHLAAEASPWTLRGVLSAFPPPELPPVPVEVKVEEPASDVAQAAPADTATSYEETRGSGKRRR